MSTAPAVFVGVDVAKAELVWAQRPRETAAVVPNDEAGIRPARVSARVGKSCECPRYQPRSSECLRRSGTAR